MRTSVVMGLYMINMETLFEFFVRTMFKGALDHSKYSIDEYSKKWFLSRGVTSMDETEKGIHMMPYCIPDIVLREKISNDVLSVIDAKYKAHDRTVRTDSLQLLSYVLITGANRCGFVFPGEETQIKHIKTGGTEYLPLQTTLMSDLKYYELILGDNLNEAVLDHLLL